MRYPIILLTAVFVACAKQPAVEPPSPLEQMSPERRAECEKRAADIYANVPTEQLPQAGPPRGALVGHPPHLPTNLHGAIVRALFLVRPDGTADTTQAVVEGYDGERFRHDMFVFVSQNPVVPAMVDGCPVWGRSDVTIQSLGIVREKRP
jgi:hypothetical protein